MAKKRSQLERAILAIDAEIAALELARTHLIRQRPATTPADRPARQPATRAKRPAPEAAA